ncbi:hypothetical protein AWZ03_012207 [Drosophila navojoa]|uniref:Uncharacterized protein n=1 Tax=Drosophila navojoa TaxID=7232 RepID=A0A484AY79_DRONA|nr:hypothetical protein AWZ03_012207 [Drosophila navojoa]
MEWSRPTFGHSAGGDFTNTNSSSSSSNSNSSSSSCISSDSCCSHSNVQQVNRQQLSSVQQALQFLLLSRELSLRPEALKRPALAPARLLPLPQWNAIGTQAAAGSSDKDDSID